LSPSAFGAIFHHRKARKATMMDEALKTHKETTFGWVLMIQAIRQRLKVKRGARRLAAQAWLATTRAEELAKSMRYLAPR
jgi:hypothetical protein